MKKRGLKSGFWISEDMAAVKFFLNKDLCAEML